MSFSWVDLPQNTGESVEYYNNQRYHESIHNLTPSDMYFGRGNEILSQRQLIKQKKMKKRRKQHLKNKLKV